MELHPAAEDAASVSEQTLMQKKVTIVMASPFIEMETSHGESLRVLMEPELINVVAKRQESNKSRVNGLS
jgi:hypothetical protein